MFHLRTILNECCHVVNIQHKNITSSTCYDWNYLCILSKNAEISLTPLEWRHFIVEPYKCILSLTCCISQPIYTQYNIMSSDWRLWYTLTRSQECPSWITLWT
jgi:hypothetical protein